MELRKGDKEEAPTTEYEQLMDDVEDAKIKLESTVQAKFYSSSLWKNA